MFKGVKEWFAGAADEFFNISISLFNIGGNLGKVIYNPHSKIDDENIGEKKDEKTKNARTTIGAIDDYSNGNPCINDKPS